MNKTRETLNTVKKFVTLCDSLTPFKRRMTERALTKNADGLMLYPGSKNVSSHDRDAVVVAAAVAALVSSSTKSLVIYMC